MRDRNNVVRGGITTNKPSLQTLVDHLAGRGALRCLLFLTATLFVLLMNGYHFGTFDQAMHIPFLKKYADPSLFPGDAFLDLRLTHYSFFWFLFLPFYQLGVLEVALFITHALVTFATFWALWSLSDTLFHNPLASLISLVALAFPHIGFGGWPMFEFSLLNRTFVLPFLLLAIILFLRRRYVLAFALVGVMFNLHVISANFVLALFLFDAVVEWREVGWRNIVLGMSVFVFAALPVLLWKMNGAAADFSLHPEWFSLITRAMLANLFDLFAPYPHILMATLSGAGVFALFFGARRFTRATAHTATLTNFVYAVLLILALQIVTAQWLPITLVVELQIIRAGVFALIFGYLYFANYLAEQYQAGVGSKFDFYLLTGTFVFSLVSVIPLIIWALQRLVKAPRWRRLMAGAALAALSAYSLALALSLNIWYPGIYIFPHKTPWYEAQIWARDNTPKETVFITPLHLWWFYESDWRVFSERATVVTHSELLEAALALPYLETWKPRFEALAPGALTRFRGNIFENLGLTAQAFYSLSREELLRAACQYGASYLVVEKPHRRDWTVVYENEQFIIYALPRQLCAAASR